MTKNDDDDRYNPSSPPPPLQNDKDEATMMMMKAMMNTSSSHHDDTNPTTTNAAADLLREYEEELDARRVRDFAAAGHTSSSSHEDTTTTTTHPSNTIFQLDSHLLHQPQPQPQPQQQPTSFFDTMDHPHNDNFPSLERSSLTHTNTTPTTTTTTLETRTSSSSVANMASSSPLSSMEKALDVEEADEEDDLARMLPGMPRSRLMAIRKTFRDTLGTPSLLSLVPILRENVPFHAGRSHTWLQKKYLREARNLMEQAKRTDHVDVHMLNGMLDVLAEHGSIDEALAHHAHAYRNKGLVSPFILVVECVPLCVCA